MHKTYFIAIVTVLSCLIGLSTQAAEYSFKYAFVHAPTHPLGIGARCFKAAVEEFTQGRVEVKVYPSGALGDEDILIESVRAGSVEMSTAGCSAVALVAPEYDFFSLPFLFRDYEHFWNVSTSSLRDILKNSLEKHGLKFLGITTGGARQIFVKKPVNSIEDLKGVSIRAMEMPAVVEALKAIGARPVPIPYSETYTSIQSGVVDGGETSVQGYINSKFFEVAPHLAKINYIMDGRAFYINRKYWDAFPPDIQQAIERAFRVHERATHTEYEKQDWLSSEQLAKLKVKVYNPPLEPFIKAMDVAYGKLNPALGKEWIAKIQAMK